MLKVAPMSQEPPVQIPHEALSQEALRGVIEAFVLREGTDYGEQAFSFEQKVAQVLHQLKRGEAVLWFEPGSESVTLAPAGTRPAPG